VTTELVDAYHRAPSGRIEFIPLNRAEAEFAAWRWPHAWSLTQTFPPQSPDRGRGPPIEPASWSPPQ
jgi:hypothetical protein